jgi:hypothetical protein
MLRERLKPVMDELKQQAGAVSWDSLISQVIFLLPSVFSSCHKE